MVSIDYDQTIISENPHYSWRMLGRDSVICAGQISLSRADRDLSWRSIGITEPSSVTGCGGFD